MGGSFVVGVNVVYFHLASAAGLSTKFSHCTRAALSPGLRTSHFQNACIYSPFSIFRSNLISAGRPRVQGAASRSSGSSARRWGNKRKQGNQGKNTNTANKKAAFPPLRAANLLALSSRSYPQPHRCLVAAALSPLASSPLLPQESGV